MICQNVSNKLARAKALEFLELRKLYLPYHDITNLLSIYLK